jgi:hypothetical protein
MVDGELAPVTNVGDGGVDGVLQAMEISNPWSSTTGASRGDGEVRLETTTASVVVGELEKLQEKEGQWCHSMRQREGRIIGESRSEGRLHRVDTNEIRQRVCTVSGEEFHQPGGSESRGEGRRRERGCWAL